MSAKFVLEIETILRTKFFEVRRFIMDEYVTIMKPVVMESNLLGSICHELIFKYE